MKNKESWQLEQERETLVKVVKKDKLGGENMKKALFQPKNMRYSGNICMILIIV